VTLRRTIGPGFLPLLVLPFALVALSFSAPSKAKDQPLPGTANGEWRYWGGDEGATRYSPLDQINAENFGKLEVAWRWKAANYGPSEDHIYRSTPIYVKGKLYTVAGQRRAVLCIDPATGETLWMWRMKENPRWQASSRQNYGKGVAWAEVDGRDVIYVITPGFYLVALDAETGLPLPYFGINGVVDLALGLGNYPVDPDRGVLDSGDITSSAPPIIVNGVIVVNNSHTQGYRPKKKENIPGHIRGYDAKTGTMLWIFHVLPQPGEYGHDTWEGDSWTYTGNISTWTPLAADSARGLVFLPTDCPTNDYYGGDRNGMNLFGTSLIALDVKTGKRVWHFQMVHHDIWNFDNPDAPKVLDVTINGKRTPIVLQATKQGFTYVFNRETGEPIWPIVEKPVPKSDVPNEKTWPTQPFPTKPAAFEQQGITEADLIDFTPELHAEALAIAKKFRMGPLFNPPSLFDAPDGTAGSFSVPGDWGGANIPGGAAVDPETGVLYVATVRGYSIYSMEPGVNQGSNAGYVSKSGSGVRVRGLNIFKPPWSSIVAIDLNTGDTMWRIPNGDTPESVKRNPALKGLDFPATGSDGSHPTILVTKTLLVYGEGRSGGKWLHAVDKKTGKELSKVAIPANTQTAPMTYMHQGKQYIVLSVADPDTPAEHVALALPK
jgi:quinoprotein glucose dehydrogenase